MSETPVEKKELKVLTPEEAGALVLDTVLKMEKIMHDTIFELHEHQRFVVGGRVVNLIFQKFYGFVISRTNALYAQEVLKSELGD